MKKNRYKIKLSGIIILILVLSMFFLTYKVLFKSSNKVLPINDNFINLTKDEVIKLCSSQKLRCNYKYEYNNIIEKDKVINSEKENDKYEVVISLGNLSEDILKEKAVNELGKVPIMMYHGIISDKKAEYIGGNVDKNGYKRTSEAFKKDLDFYYENDYRMVRLIDYVNGEIDVQLGYSPLILTFDDGDQNNFNVLGKDSNGNLEIDPNCAVGILEEYKKKYPNFNVTATFFVMEGLFNQSEYNEDIMKWLVNNGYDIGNHTINHSDFTKINAVQTQEVVGKMYQKLESILGNKYVPIIALPYGSPYKKTHSNYSYILKGTYDNKEYKTEAALRVGWESEVSPFDKNFDSTFLKRCRAYDNNGLEFDIEMVFKNLVNNRYISDGNKDTITIKSEDSDKINNSITKKIIKY